MDGPNNFKTPAWCALAAMALVWLYVLGLRTLVPPDEGRYAEMAREMLASGDWITTRLNGIKYFEKPPLQTWMNALSFAAFGLGDWQARLWTGLCALLGIALTGLAGARVFNPRVGLYASLVLGSSLYWITAGQINSLDMGLSGMMTVSLCALLVAQRDGATQAQRRNWMLLCWAGMALAVLSKGLIGVVLPGAVLVLYTLAARDWGLWTRLHLGKGLALFFAVAAPWFVLVALANPEQPHFFFIHEHVERFLLKTHHRENVWYMFIVLLLVGSVPWIAVLPQSLLHALRRDRAARFQPQWMLLIWAVFILFFFSYSSSKLPGYIVPIFPAVALLIAVYLDAAPRRALTLAAAVIAALGAAGMALSPKMPALARLATEMPLMAAWQPWALAAAACATAGAALSFLCARRDRRDMAVLALAGAGFAAAVLLLVGSEPFGKQRAGLAVVPKIRAELRADTRLYSVGMYEQSLPFYLGRTMTLVDYTDEFEFGLKQQPALSIPHVDDFVAQWTRDAEAGVRDVAVIRDDIYLKLQERGVPMRIVMLDTRRIVVANR